MKMIGHQTIDTHLPVGLFARFGQGFDKQAISSFGMSNTKDQRVAVLGDIRRLALTAEMICSRVNAESSQAMARSSPYSMTRSMMYSALCSIRIASASASQNSELKNSGRRSPGVFPSMHHLTRKRSGNL